LPDWSTIAALRFGAGRSPAGDGPGRADDLLAELSGPDSEALRFPTVSTREAVALADRFEGKKVPEMSEEDRAKLREDSMALIARALAASAARWVAARYGFRERLEQFWASHFAVRARSGRWRAVVPAFAEEALRPNLGGRFGDLLKAAVLHPAMLAFLDQEASVGPNSPFAQRRKKKGPGLNENLARELLELHTMGVGAGYAQADVRALATLLTGLTISPEGETVFDARRAEPGAETVLGKRWGGRPERVESITDFLDELALRPETARFVSAKLARHFTADLPATALVEAMAARFLETGGDLPKVYEVLLTHPEAEASFGGKVRQPFDYLLAAFRALGVTPEAILGAKPRDLKRALSDPMAAMGQPWGEPPGPDGWPEEASVWIAPQTLAARIDWAMAKPSDVLGALPDPRAFAETALGSAAPEDLRVAVSRAESQAEGLGLVLASPAFNRR
jgi:uncharacterized protein (DUF1800 family)